MSALAELSKIFGQQREIQIGQSFFANDAHGKSSSLGNAQDQNVFHTIRYDFKPASIDPNRTAAMDIGRNGKVTIALPNVEGAQGGQTESVYQGQIKPHQKECVLIIDHETGQITLERLAQSLIVKKTRAISNNANKLLNNEDLNNERTTNAPSHNANKSSQPASSIAVLPPSQPPPPPASIKYSTSNGKSPAAIVANGQKLTANINGKRVSPPLSTTKQTANGKSTPSPPSMPIFNRGALVHTDPMPASTAKSSALTSISARRSTTPPNKNVANNASTDHSSSPSLSSSSSSSDSENSDADDSVRLENAKTKKIGAKRTSPSTAKPSNGTSNNLSMPSFQALASSTTVRAPSPPRSGQPTNGNSSSSAISNQFKKHKSLALSEESDSESNDEDFEKSKMNGELNKNVITNGDSTLKFTNGSSNNLSMPRFSTTLSQDLQLSESSDED